MHINIGFKIPMNQKTRREFVITAENQGILQVSVGLRELKIQTRIIILITILSLTEDMIMKRLLLLFLKIREILMTTYGYWIVVLQVI